MCQNWEISQPAEIFGEDMGPQVLVDLALKTKSHGIAYTYTEPTIFYEYAKDTALLAREKGLYNVFVTNGYMTPETIGTLSWLDAARVDLKAFDDKFYMEVCGGAHLEPVLKSIRLLHSKMHIEVITLLIPTLNDSDDELRALSKWVAELGRDIPLHFTAYYPSNRMTLPPTPVETLARARKIAIEEGVHYVYTGNRPGDEGESTYCPTCRRCVVKRTGFAVEEMLLEGDRCSQCGHRIPIIMDWKRGRKD
jgi:pyruvate formate lyase activating enzyme